MKVIQTVESFYPFVSGPANQVYWTARGLIERGHVCKVVTTNADIPENSPAHEKIDGVDVFRYPVKCRLARYMCSPQMREAFDDFDIVHSNNYRNYQADTAYEIARKNKKPFVIHTHGGLLGYQKFKMGFTKTVPYKIYDFFTGAKTVRKADAIIACSNQEKQDALEFGLPEEKVHVIFTGVEIPDTAAPQKDDEILKLLFVGRIARNRNLDTVIKAVAGLDNVLLTVVGGEQRCSSMSKLGYVDEMKMLTKDLGAESKINFAGPKYKDDLKAEYANAHAFIYPSFYENFGQTILEAASYGLPLITSRVGVALELIKEGSTGFFVEPQNVNQIQECIEQLRSAKIRKEFSEKLYDRVKKDFSWDTALDKIIRLYEGLL